LCDGDGKYVVVVKAKNGQIAVAYNADGFSSVDRSSTPNTHGFIVPFENYNGRFGSQFNRNGREEEGILHSLVLGFTVILLSLPILMSMPLRVALWGELTDKDQE
jgi:hypothetical protein